MLALARMSPVDPVERLIDGNDFSTNQKEFAEIYQQTSIKNGLNKAPFYFSLNRSNYHKSFYSIANPLKKSITHHFLQANYDFKSIVHCFDAIYNESNTENIEDLWNYQSSTPEELMASWEIKLNQFQDIKTKIDLLKASKNNRSAWIPSLFFHGKNNRFHDTLITFFTMNWGNSLSDGKSAQSKIFNALPLTLLILLLNVIFGIGIGLLLGIWFHKSSSIWTKSIEQLLYVLKSIPLFVFALFMLNSFTTSEISPLLKIFPAVNAYGWSTNSGFWVNVGRNFNQLILPVLCLVILGVAYVSRLVKTSLNRESSAIYNQTAMMKGLPKSQVLKHKLNNIRGIIVTLISNKLIAGIGGSVIIEYIFNIPGMGRLFLDSVRENDLVVMMPIVLIIFIFSSIVMLVSDLLYMRFNPQISVGNG